MYPYGEAIWSHLHRSEADCPLSWVRSEVRSPECASRRYERAKDVTILERHRLWAMIAHDNVRCVQNSAWIPSPPVWPSAHTGEL